MSERNTASDASLLEDENTRNEVREIVTDIMATSTTKLTHFLIRLARSFCLARSAQIRRRASRLRERNYIRKCRCSLGKSGTLGVIER